MTRNASLRPLLNLVAAAGRANVNRRDLVKIAGAAALSAGLAQTLPGARQVLAQPEKNAFIFGSGQDISNLDPHTGNDYSITWGQRATYDSLLRFEGTPPVVKPLVAREATGSADALTWTIKLDERAVFPDGSKVDATVVQWNFKRLLTKNKGVSWMFADVMTPDSVKVVDPLTVEIKLSRPFAPFDLILPWLFLANPALVAQHDAGGDDMGEKWLLENAAGSGPYTISRFEPGSVYQFDRRTDYWFSIDTVQKPIDTFVWRIIRESSSKRIAIEAGEVQYGDVLAVEDAVALGAETDGRFVLDSIASFAPFSVKLNNEAGPTADVNVRKALAAALDYDAVLAAVSNRGQLMEGPLPVQLTPWHKTGLPVIRHDLDAARKYLSESGFASGFDLEYVYVTGIDIEEQVGLILLEKLAEMNINLTITPLVWPDLVARAADPATSPGMLAVYGSANYIDPDNFLWSAYHSSRVGSWSNASQYKNADFDKLISDARSTVVAADRKKLYDQAQTMLVDQAVEIWAYNEIPNEAWVKELGKTAPIDAVSDIRLIQYAG